MKIVVKKKKKNLIKKKNLYLKKNLKKQKQVHNPVMTKKNYQLQRKLKLLKK